MKPLKGVKFLSLALNLPGPATLMRLHGMGARCVKLEPPASSGDPMQAYAPEAYAELHRGVRIVHADLKTEQGQGRLHRELAATDVLLTSFRPSALQRLGLGWKALHKRYPSLCLVRIVGWPGEGAEIAGHDLTYMAENDLIHGLDLPSTLYADMAGALLATEAVLGSLLQRKQRGKGCEHEVALSDAATWLAKPRRWGLTQPRGAVGGAHAGYRVYACQDCRVAVAALEPHFAHRLGELAGLPHADMLAPATHEQLQRWFSGQTRVQLDRYAQTLDLPLLTMP